MRREIIDPSVSHGHVWQYEGLDGWKKGVEGSGWGEFVDRWRCLSSVTWRCSTPHLSGRPIWLILHVTLPDLSTHTNCGREGVVVGRERERERARERGGGREGGSERERGRQTETERERQRDTQRERERQTDRHRERQTDRQKE